MLYLVKYQKIKGGKDLYSLFETHTNSLMQGDVVFVREIINKYGIEVKNMFINNAGVQIKEWPNGINIHSTDDYDKESSYILLGKITEEKFKLVDPTRKVIYLDQHRLRHFIMMGAVANCKRMGKEDIQYKSVDTYSMRQNIGFEAIINRKYAEFVAKAALLNMRMTFEYIVENDDVKITRYTGDRGRVIIPNFITTVCDRAFSYRGITEIKLNKGLKHIGNSAFLCNSIGHVELPEMLELLWVNAFDTQIDYDHEYDIVGNVYNSIDREVRSNTIIIR